MNDQDKVLISAYLDNELTQEENSYVESLIKEDSEAFNYLNKIKEINNQTESFFQEALNSNEFKNFQAEYEQDILVFRSGESDDFLNQVKNVAMNLIKEGKQKAKGSYGDKDYTLQITKEATINAESKCFLAEFESINEQKLFSICKSGQNSSILEVTQ